jgi:hypothetical protein
MLIAENSSGWKFIWLTGSDLIEVYHPDASFPEFPVDVIVASGIRYNDSDLRKLANETSEYGRSYA